MWILIIKNEYFKVIFTILKIVRSKSQTSIHIIGYPYFILRIMTNQYKIKRWGRYEKKRIGVKGLSSKFNNSYNYNDSYIGESKSLHSQDIS